MTISLSKICSPPPDDSKLQSRHQTVLPSIAMRFSVCFSDKAAKADKAEALVTGGRSKPVTRIQAMNEATLVLSRKMGLS